MAVKPVVQAVDYVCLSTDTKPTTNVPAGSTVFVLDSKAYFIYDGIGTWYAMA